MKKFVAWARVSSQQQEREGFSLDVQEAALKKYANDNNGEVVKLWKVAESASKQGRKLFREMMHFVKKNHRNIDGILVYKIDRAVRNLPDFVELERIESEYHVPLISVTEPTLDTAAGRMGRRMLAAMGTFFAEQLSEVAGGGVLRRVQEGWFPQRPPYGYRTCRINGRCVVEAHPENGPKVTRIFRMYAYEGHTLESLAETLLRDGIIYQQSKKKFYRSILFRILCDRSYIGEVWYQEQYHRGKHPPLVDQTTWDRVRVLLNQKTMRSHQMTYGSRLVRCGHCGHFITGELKTKQRKSGPPKDYHYYRCGHMSQNGHPRVRLTEADFDAQTLVLFQSLHIEDPEIRAWFVRVLRERTMQEQRDAKDQTDDLNRQLTINQNKQVRLLDMHLMDEIDRAAYSTKLTNLRDEENRLRLKLEAVSRNRQEEAEVVVEAFELSQSLCEKWLTADYAAKRKILEILLLNCILNDVTLSYEMRTPFDVLVEGQSLTQRVAGGSRTHVPRFTAGSRYHYGFGHSIPVRNRTSPSTFAGSCATNTPRG